MTYPGWTMQKVRAQNHAAGFHWFSPGAIRFFSARFGRRTYVQDGLCFFVSSEQFSDSNGTTEPRRYTVRLACPRGHIQGVSEFQQFSTRAQAIRWLRARSYATEC